MRSNDVDGDDDDVVEGVDGDGNVTWMNDGAHDDGDVADDDDGNGDAD